MTQRTRQAETQQPETHEPTTRKPGSDPTTSIPQAPAAIPLSTTALAPGTAAPQPLAAPFPPLAEPRPLGEHRVWPRTFHDRLTAPLPGLKALARFARDGAVRPGRGGLADAPGSRAHPPRCPAPAPAPSPSRGPDTPAGSSGSAA
ncbi:hypothetical protein GCM10010339_41670 [Streptomyces alanosinicus]|uniref:Uncharacterized protein n=1 Tax=Streptomyces alanosinicus TaxID=68171 RepID=A0A919D3F8_9ACTN|nr:hypothetical protein GCM10010339_41670 [Streptomyces alanosinicus]